MQGPFKQLDTKEFELPDTVFIHDIESRIFQSIALECLARIEGIALLEGNLLDTLLGRDPTERVKGIHVNQDEKSRAVNIKVEVNVAYGIHIPVKAEEIQSKIVEEISRHTGLHVGCVHVVFKNLISSNASIEELLQRSSRLGKAPALSAEQYNEEF